MPPKKALPQKPKLLRLLQKRNSVLRKREKKKKTEDDVTEETIAEEAVEEVIDEAELERQRLEARKLWLQKQREKYPVAPDGHIPNSIIRKKLIPPVVKKAEEKEEKENLWKLVMIPDKNSLVPGETTDDIEAALVSPLASKGQQQFGRKHPGVSRKQSVQQLKVFSDEIQQQNQQQQQMHQAARKNGDVVNDVVTQIRSENLETPIYEESFDLGSARADKPRYPCPTPEPQLRRSNLQKIVNDLTSLRDPTDALNYENNNKEDGQALADDKLLDVNQQPGENYLDADTGNFESSVGGKDITDDADVGITGERGREGEEGTTANRSESREDGGGGGDVIDGCGKKDVDGNRANADPVVRDDSEFGNNVFNESSLLSRHVSTDNFGNLGEDEEGEDKEEEGNGEDLSNSKFSAPIGVEIMRGMLSTVEDRNKPGDSKLDRSPIDDEKKTDYEFDFDENLDDNNAEDFGNYSDFSAVNIDVTKRIFKKNGDDSNIDRNESGEDKNAVKCVKNEETPSTNSIEIGGQSYRWNYGDKNASRIKSATNKTNYIAGAKSATSYTAGVRSIQRLRAVSADPKKNLGDSRRSATLKPGRFLREEADSDLDDWLSAKDCVEDGEGGHEEVRSRKLVLRWEDTEPLPSIRSPTNSQLGRFDSQLGTSQSADDLSDRWRDHQNSNQDEPKSSAMFSAVDTDDRGNASFDNSRTISRTSSHDFRFVHHCEYTHLIHRHLHHHISVSKHLQSKQMMERMFDLRQPINRSQLKLYS